ncbi:unnamed protein product, partial [marine sediment metagenome]
TMYELYDAINQYLDDPSLDEKNRKKIVENEAGPYRGNAGEKIGRYILSLVGI